MTIYVHEDEVPKTTEAHLAGAELIGPQQGAVNGYSVGVAIYFLDTYGEPGVHDDQEGFYVVEGSGKARVGDVEFDIRPGSAFIATRGFPMPSNETQTAGRSKSSGATARCNNFGPRTGISDATCFHYHPV